MEVGAHCTLPPLTWLSGSVRQVTALSRLRGSRWAVLGLPFFLPGEAADALEGRRLDEEVINEAANKAVSAITPISDVRASAGYRSNIVAVLVKRGIWEVARKLDGAT